MSILKKTKNILYFMAKPIAENRKNTRLKNNAYYLNCLRNLKIKENKILLESYHGVSFTGNSYAIFKKIIQSYKHFKCYIVIKDLNDPMIDWIKKTYNNNDFEVVEYESKKYLKLLATCKYLINDTSFMPYFIKRNKQIYLNTWHGTPFKTLGTDIKNANFNDHKNIQKNFYSADKLALPNKYTANKLINSLNLNGILNSQIKITGNARVDLTINSNSNEIINKYNLVNNKKIVLFAPTWKKDEKQTTKQDILNLISQTKKIQQTLGDNYHVYLKTHYFIYTIIKELNLDKNIIPNWVDTNELLSVVDLLITDYSSIFFDFLPMKRPIYFYMPDKDQYEKERGLYLDIQTLPGDVAYDFSTLLNNISGYTKTYLNKYKNNIENFINLYCYKDDGFSAEKTVDFLLGINEGIKEYKSQKKVIVFYGGGFYNNGITNSLINLSKILDYNRYEFILIENDNLFDEKIRNLNKLDKRVHCITLFSYTNRNLIDTYNENLLYRQGLDSKLVNERRLNNIFNFEFKRVFGNLEPDVLIDYCGYYQKFTALFAFAPVNKKVIYLHNDMLGEYNKKINGNYKHRWHLKVIFSLYNKFDKIISVSESVNKINKRNLSAYINNYEKKMIAISNIINGDEIIEQSSFEKNIKLFKETKLKYPIPEKNNYNFINVARLSPEKNHETLIKAFHKVVNKYNNSKLYILGDGPLFEKLNDLINSLNLNDSVYLLGHIRNPFVYIKMCDCFVLTSNYEGQGMVILEAQTLNKPVIGTNVTGINSILNESNGLMVENNINAIANGLMAYINGEIPAITFNYKKYNYDIMKKIEKHIL
ncbi:glycosyltransferase [Staphylococcus pasteuri]|uniref:glycosyltransferase n=1 Tax=Staphylococcus pasteuri TaxID=45972 RepID=UPI0012B6BA88|nr:glycosyltransferase [Staphylococcus pasteuri]